MVDLLEVRGLSSTPATDQHRVVRRVQVQSSPERVKRRLVKRLMMREGIAEDQAVARVVVKPAEFLQFPFVTLQSSSTRQHFRLFISHEPVQQNAVVGTFSAYGLSTTATVPWF
jgi:CRISPR-associated endonuclease Csy4